jgi:NADH-quinone oxidoreductase subunit M
VLGAAITAVYILRLIGRTFYGDRDPKWDNLTDLTRREFIAATILLIPLFYAGLYPQPLLRVIRPGVDAILAGLGV